MKFNKPQYMNKFVKSPATVTLSSGEAVLVYSIAQGLTDVELNEWAKYILGHYISDEDIADGMVANGKTRQEYIQEFVLPTTGKDKSGNFGEIIFADFIEYILNYTVPRYKFYGIYPNNPTQGIDIVAYKKDAITTENDTVLYSEIKSKLSTKSFVTLQSAINDISGRDDAKFALALDNTRRELKKIGDVAEAEEIKRFQNSEKPCRRIRGAGLITLADACSSTDFVGVKMAVGADIETHVIYASDIWNIVQDLWRRASL